MGCRKLSYDTERQFPSPYIKVWSGGTKEKTAFFREGARENGGNPDFFYNDYYPFGLSFNSYQRQGEKANDFLYNGKERQDELDLGWMDYGARMYDGAVGRFFTQDRFAEKYLDFTPYQYGANNPIKYIDVNGDSIIVNGVRYVVGQKYEGKDKYVAAVFMALNYLVENKADTKDIISELAGHKTDHIDILENTKENNEYFKNPRRKSYYNPNIDKNGNSLGDDFLIWDQNHGVEFDEYDNVVMQFIFGDTEVRSPAEILLHELGHKKSYMDNPEQHIKDAKTINIYYGNKEEYDVIWEVENPAAQRLNHMKRTHHNGVFVPVKSPISNEKLAND